jgi:hypothetical protein
MRFSYSCSACVGIAYGRSEAYLNEDLVFNVFGSTNRINVLHLSQPSVEFATIPQRQECLGNVTSPFKKIMETPQPLHPTDPLDPDLWFNKPFIVWD